MKMFTLVGLRCEFWQNLNLRDFVWLIWWVKPCTKPLSLPIATDFDHIWRCFITTPNIATSVSRLLFYGGVLTANQTEFGVRRPVFFFVATFIFWRLTPDQCLISKFIYRMQSKAFLVGKKHFCTQITAFAVQFLLTGIRYMRRKHQ